MFSHAPILREKIAIKLLSSASIATITAMRVTVICLVLLGCINANPNRCDPDWSLFTNRCYKQFRTGLITQPVAEAACVKLGGHLASITSEAENAFLHGLTQLGGTHPFDNQPWIGLVDNRWTDGSPLNYSAWAPGEPNNVKTVCTQFCPDSVLNQYSGRSGLWNDCYCTLPTRRYICEKAAAPDPRACAGDWNRFEENCYKQFRTGLITQPVAEAACVEEGGHLASILSAAENEFLHRLTKIGGIRPFSNQPWIGLVDGRWTDGSPFNYSAWAPGEPNNVKTVCTQFCPDSVLNRYSGRSGLWNDCYCTLPTQRYICKKPAPLLPVPEVVLPPLPPVSSVGGARAKCEHAPYMSYFHEKTLTCYIRTDQSCSSIQFSTPFVHGEPDSETEKGMRKHRVLSRGETVHSARGKICAFGPQLFCNNAVSVGTDCFELGKEKKTWNEAKYECSKSNSYLFVPHSDEDIQKALSALTSTPTSEAFWLGSSRHDKVWSNYDGSVVDFFRWENINDVLPEELVASTLSNDQSETFGYENLAAIQDRNYYICHRRAGGNPYTPTKNG